MVGAGISFRFAVRTARWPCSWTSEPDFTFEVLQVHERVGKDPSIICANSLLDVHRFL